MSSVAVSSFHRIIVSCSAFVLAMRCPLGVSGEALCHGLPQRDAHDGTTRQGELRSGTMRSRKVRLATTKNGPRTLHTHEVIGSSPIAPTTKLTSLHRLTSLP